MGEKKWWEKTTAERYADHVKELEKAREMDTELAKYGRRTATGGMVWTVGDLARFFLDQHKRGEEAGR